MYNNNAIEGILLAILASAAIGGIIISSTRMGFNEDEKKEGMRVLCIVLNNQKNVKPLMII